MNSTPYRDSQGKSLFDYPRPSLAVDTAVLTVRQGELQIALVEKNGSRRLPGTFVHQGETLKDAVHRSLENKAGITGLVPKLLAVLDDPERDNRGWVVSVAHLIVVPADALPDVQFTALSQAGHLAFDHDHILDLAVHTIQQQYAEHPDPWRILGEEFTLAELQDLHEIVNPNREKKDTFRRRMERQLVDTGQMSRGSVGKPARLFRHRPSEQTGAELPPS